MNGDRPTRQAPDRHNVRAGSKSIARCERYKELGLHGVRYTVVSYGAFPIQLFCGPRRAKMADTDWRRGDGSWLSFIAGVSIIAMIAVARFGPRTRGLATEGIRNRGNSEPAPTPGMDR
jgi:hypothetical protein